jgi:hypothetical protein
MGGLERPTLPTEITKTMYKQVVRDHVSTKSANFNSYFFLCFLLDENGVPSTIPASTGWLGWSRWETDLFMQWVMSAAMAFGKESGGGCLLLPSRMAACCTSRTLHENQTGRGLLHVLRMASRPSGNGTEATRPFIMHTTLLLINIICGPRIQSHSRPSTKIQALVLPSAAHPIRDVIC